MDKIFRLIHDETTGLPIGGLTVRAVRIEDSTAYPMVEIGGTDGVGQYITTDYCPAGSYRLEKFVTGSWVPITTGDATPFIVEVEPGMFNQQVNTTDSGTVVEKSSILREEIHVSAFVPNGSQGTATHIASALTYAANSSLSAPLKVVVGNCRNRSTWNIASTLTVPDGVELDLAGAKLVYSTGSSAVVSLGEGSKLTNGIVIYAGTGSAISTTATVRGALVTSEVWITGAGVSCPSTAQITFLSASKVEINDAATIDPYSNATINANPETLIDSVPVNLSGRGASSLVTAKVKPKDLQALFHRLLSPSANKGSAVDFLVSPFSDDTAMSGEQVGRALRAIVKAWGTLLNGTHRSQFKNTAIQTITGTGAMVNIAPAGVGTFIIPANGLQIGSTVRGTISINPVNPFPNTVCQVQVVIAGFTSPILYVEMLQSRNTIIDFQAKMFDGGSPNLSVRGFLRASNATTGSEEVVRFGGANIDKTAANTVTPKINIGGGSNSVQVEVFDLVVDK